MKHTKIISYQLRIVSLKSQLAALPYEPDFFHTLNVKLRFYEREVSNLISTAELRKGVFPNQESVENVKSHDRKTLAMMQGRGKGTVSKGRFETLQPGE